MIMPITTMPFRMYYYFKSNPQTYKSTISSLYVAFEKPTKLVYSNNNIVLCFQPGVDMGTIRHTEPTTTLAAYLDLEDQQTQPCSNCRCSTNSAISLPPKPALSRTARAIVFGTILIKRVRERKIHRRPKSDGGKGNLSLDSVRFQVKENRESVKRKLDGIYQENGEISVSSGSVQPFSISISEPKILNKKTGCGNEVIGVKQREMDRSRSCYAFNSSVRLVMVSLGVTVMQGRVIGILITSILVYFFAWMQMEDCWLKNKATKLMKKRENRH